MSAHVDELATDQLHTLDRGQREGVRRLTLRSVISANLIFLASGVLGLVIRDSQADLGRVSSNEWYAIMTAHGVAAFIGWGAFAVMAFSWWLLAKLGFPLRRFGHAMAEATYWLMMAGAVGVLVTTLVLHFAASWVFLYPLSFHGAGEWGKWTTAIFSLSVLLAGLAIVTWCLSILAAVIGPALGATSRNPLNRLGVAMGFGYLMPKRFPTDESKPVPYALIPLTVIGIDMIIATLPLAVLLVMNIVQSFVPGASVDPLLAKNILWWFGHPVVYLLLFPAAALYYYMIPRHAGRPLVAGKLIAVAWAIAVIANVFVWAHHVYIDYPEGSVQGAINIAMQPMTFALTIPSALSLYSLAFTIYRSNYKWDAVGTTLFLGIFSWFLAGLSGLVNATVTFDQVVHNTLWIVGHFHHMALLNIGFVIFAATYKFVPELLGKKLYSDSLAKWHIWLTFIGQIGGSTFWMIQGLQGAPRRWAILPDHYVTLSQVALPFIWLMGAAQLLFLYNMVQTARGATAKRRFSTATVEGIVMTCVVVALAAGAGAGIWAGIGFGGKSGSSTAGAGTTSMPAQLAARGKSVFASSGCGACHTLAAAGAAGSVGPNLDQQKPPATLVVARVTDGKGAMPAFKGRLSDGDIQAVAAFVAQSAGK